MKLRKRPVVQLTSLMDMLFIMIFASLLSQNNPPSDSSEISDDPQKLKKQVKTVLNENDILKRENKKLKMDARSEEESKTAVNPGQYRNLFVANLYYLDGEYRYKETKIFTADDETGLFSYRLNLTDAGVIQGRKKPMTETEADNFKKCESVSISREKIYEECTYQTGWDRTLDCVRSDDEYQCEQHQVRKNKQGKEQEQTWKYKMKLIKIYDPDLV